jgi:hypothetical protein
MLALDKVPSVQPPALSQEQRSAATAKAIANRQRRAQVKEQLRTGELTWHALLELARIDDVVAGLRVSEALLSLPGVGPSRLDRLMKQARVAATRRLRGLGDNQISVLTGLLIR